jgi:hypothetical protein
MRDLRPQKKETWLGQLVSCPSQAELPAIGGNGRHRFSLLTIGYSLIIWKPW